GPSGPEARTPERRPKRTRGGRMHRSQSTPWCLTTVMLVAAGLTVSALAAAQTAGSEVGRSSVTHVRNSTEDEIQKLKEQLALQQKEIEKLQEAVEQQKQLLLQAMQVRQPRPTNQTPSVMQEASAGRPVSESPNL